MKKYIIASGLIVAGSYLYQEKVRLERIIDNLKIIIRSIKNISIKKGNLIFDLNLSLFNPDEEDLILSSGFVKIKKLNIKDSETNKILADTKLNMNRIEIKSKDSIDIPTIRIYLPLLEAASIALQFISNSTDVDKLMERLEYVLEVKYFGIEHEVSI